MNDFIIQLIEGGGYLGIAVLMALENIFPPLPSEVIMGVAGVAVHQGRMGFWPVLIWGTVGATIGNYAWFYLGHRLGYQRLKPFVVKYGRWLTMDWSQVEATSRFFRKYGQWVVFFLRFSPLMRTIISLPAGLAHMKTWKFLVYTAAGSAIWNAVLIGSASLLAEWISGFEHVIGYLVIALLVIGAIFYVWRVVTWTPRGRADEPAE